MTPPLPQADCFSLCPDDKREHYAHVWEAPVYSFAVCSAFVRIFGSIRYLRKVSRRVFGNGLRLLAADTVWQVPADVQPCIRPDAKIALSLMVRGAAMHVSHEAEGAAGGPDTAVDSDGVAQLVRISAREAGGARQRRHPVVSLLQSFLARVQLLCSKSSCSRATLWARTLWAQRRPLKRQGVVTGDRFMQHSNDLTTLRYSWNDYVLTHEIADRPFGQLASGGRYQVVVKHGLPGCRWRLIMSFDDEYTYD